MRCICNVGFDEESGVFAVKTLEFFDCALAFDSVVEIVGFTRGGICFVSWPVVEIDTADLGAFCSELKTDCSA